MSTYKSFAAFIDALALTTSALRAHMRKRFKDCNLDLTSEMMQVMYYLWDHNGVNQQEIADAVNRDKATLTSLIDNLVRRQLVERREDPQDRRSKRIVLTAKGQDLKQHIVPLLHEMHTLAGQMLPENQLRATTSVLERITQNLTAPTG